MASLIPTRPSLAATALLVAASLLSSATTKAQARGHGAPPTAHGGGYGPHVEDSGRQRSTVTRGSGQEHLPAWMNRHGTLSPADQQRALEREPGFRDLAPPVQQRMRDRLTQLNGMPPQQRQRVLDRTEAMERLAPEQRQQIRGSMQQLSSLAPEQRHAVSQAFRAYRGLPPEQRQAALASGRLAAPLSPEARSTFNNLISVEPYLPPPPATAHPPHP